MFQVEKKVQDLKKLPQDEMGISILGLVSLGSWLWLPIINGSLTCWNLNALRFSCIIQKDKRIALELRQYKNWLTSVKKMFVLKLPPF